MTGIIERMRSIAGADTTKIADFANSHFSSRMRTHGHTGRALVETAAELCRQHPNLVGLAAGVMVERLLVVEKKHHEAHLAEVEPTAEAVAGADKAKAPKKVKRAKALKTGDHALRLHALKPGRTAFEVFGGLLLLKMAASGARIFRHKHQGEVWFAPAAKIRLFSATLCTYNLVKAFRSPKVSAWRNGAVLFFGTDAIKPVLKWYKTHPVHSWEHAPAAAEPAVEAKPDHAFDPPAAVVGFGLPPLDFSRPEQQAAS